MWWGVFVHASPVFAASSSSWGYACVLSPLLTMTLLLCLSGMPTAEGDNQKRFMRTRADRAAYLEYRAATSPVLPLPRWAYRPLPLWLKRWALLEWCMYETDWEYCGEGGGAAATPTTYNSVGVTAGSGGSDKSEPLVRAW